jgi:hypothetical protein
MPNPVEKGDTLELTPVKGRVGGRMIKAQIFIAVLGLIVGFAGTLAMLA